VLEKYPQDVKLVVKNYPLSRHKYARLAAAAALSANNQGKFWEFHHRLFKNQRTLNEGEIQEIAKELHLDMVQFNRDMSSPAIRMLIDRDLRDAYDAEVSGIPAVFLNGKGLRKLDLRSFSEAIDEELRKIDRSSAKGS
jgi:protein-disulfide isomerase